MSDHAPLAPSAAHRWMRCPGSVRLCAGRESPETVYSREGTFAHMIAADCLRLGLPARAKIGQSDGEFTVDAVMAAHLQVYLDVITDLVMIEDGELQVEERVTLSNQVYGTADALIWSGDGDRLHVVDLKYGAGTLVPAVGNEQLQIYGLAALSGLSSGLHLHIVQPRRSEDGGHRLSVLSYDEALAFWVEIAEAQHATSGEDAPLVSGDHCTFCPAAATCPQLAKDALQAAVDVFPKGDPAQPVTPPEPTALSTVQLSQILSSAAIVETWLKAVRDQAHERATHGVVIPGWKLVERIGNRKWIDDGQAMQQLQAAGIDPWEPSTLVSPAQAEKRLGKKGAPLIQPLVERPVTGVLLVPDADKRPAANPGAVFLPSESNLFE